MASELKFSTPKNVPANQLFGVAVTAPPLTVDCMSFPFGKASKNLFVWTVPNPALVNRTPIPLS